MTSRERLTEANAAEANAAEANAAEANAAEASTKKVHGSEADEDAALARAIEEGLKSEQVSKQEILDILQTPDGD